MITADTITDEQIRELLLSTPLFGDREVEAVALAALFPVDEAYPGDSGAGARKAVREARARCAEILSARAAKEQRP